MPKRTRWERIAILSSRARALSLSLCFFLSERKGRSERERGRGSERDRHKEHKRERERESRSDGETESMSACASFFKNCFCPFCSVNMWQEYSCVYVCVCTYVFRTHTRTHTHTHTMQAHLVKNMIMRTFLHRKCASSCHVYRQDTMSEGKTWYEEHDDTHFLPQKVCVIMSCL